MPLSTLCASLLLALLAIMVSMPQEIRRPLLAILWRYAMRLALMVIAAGAATAML